MKRVLMIAYHFPPLAGSSGVQRTLRFARHLPQFGWEPLVLTAHPRAYQRTSADLMQEVAEGTVVERAFALDAARHLAIGRYYPAFAARPDRWVSWWLGAVPKGLEMIRKYRPRAIWSTFPLATAHRIGHSLRRLSKLPWIADFRDPMAQEGYPPDPKTWKSYQAIEQAVLREAACSVFVTPGAARMYRERYVELAESRIALIENGYDEDSFTGLEEAAAKAGALAPGKVTLVHSGTVYPNERDPRPFFRALRRMLDEGRLKPAELRVRLRAAGHERLLRRLIDQTGVAEMVELAPSIAYREALLEMLRADGLLVLQAANCNEQVPAKVYEYLRCGRPILALTDPAGDTAGVLRRAGLTDIAPLDSEQDIMLGLQAFLDRVKRRVAPLPALAAVREGSRVQRTKALVELLEALPTHA